MHKKTTHTYRAALLHSMLQENSVAVTVCSGRAVSMPRVYELFDTDVSWKCRL